MNFKKIFPCLFAVALFFIGGSDVFAYDFAHWKGATVTNFDFRLVDDQWYRRTSNTEFEWLFRPDFPAGDETLINMYQFGGNLYVGEQTLKKGTATIQLALGYDDTFSGSSVCKWFNDFTSKSLEYSSNGNNWFHFDLSSFTCNPQEQFVIIGYNMTIPSEINFNRVSFGIINETSIQNRVDTLFTAINIISSEDGTQAIINQNQTIIDQNNTQIQQGQETNENLEDIKNSITDETSPNTGGLSDVAGWLPPGPLDNLLNLPLSMFNAISRDLSSTCSPVKLPLPYINENLTLPCMSSFYEGIKINSFMDWIGIITSGLMLYSYLMKLYKWVDDTLTFRENNHQDWGGV